MGLSVRVSGGSDVSVAAATAVSSVGVSIASTSVLMLRTSPVVSPCDAADAIRASNTAEFAEFGTGDYRDDHSTEASTSDVLV